MTAFWTFPAEEDLAGIVRWSVEAVGRARAHTIATRLIAAAEALDTFPLQGRPGRIVGTRELVVGDYILVYEVLGESPHILRCLHGRRAWPQE